MKKSKFFEKLHIKPINIAIWVMVIMAVVMFAFSIFSSVMAFMSDTVRVASDATASLSRMMAQAEEKYVDHTKLLAEKCASFRNDDATLSNPYTKLLAEFNADPDNADFYSIVVCDDAGDHHEITGSKFYEPVDPIYKQMVKTTGESITFVRRSKGTTNSFNLYHLEPVLQYKNEYAETVGAYCIYTVTPIRTVYAGEEFTSFLETYNAEIYLVDTVTNDGKMYFSITTEGMRDGTTSFNACLTEKYSKDFSIELLNDEDNDGKTQAMFDNENYIATQVTHGSSISGTKLFVIYKEITLQTLENPYYTRALVMFAICGLCVAITWILEVIEKHNLHVRMQKNDDVVDFLNCSTSLRFKRDAERLILDNRAKYYAIIGFSFSNLEYIHQNYGEDTEMEVKKYMANVIGSVLQKNETYGYISGGNFAILMNYELTAEVPSRVTLIKELINHYSAFTKMNFVAQFDVGVYYIKPTDKVDIEDFMNKEYIAMLSHKKDHTKTMSVYDQHAYEDYQIQAEIESKMGNALKNEDFHLLFQPKYSVTRDRIEGAETLIRWYDPERGGYIPPNRFIHLFELNGFITQLDEYIFRKVCIFLQGSIQNRLPITNINVNVSRVTATQKNFVQNYAEIKRKHGIPDGYITIEFTESFSFTDMDVQKKIAIDLRKNGFRTAIDDFGSGYSSCGILKELPVDELKLDIFLLKAGANAKHDRALIELMVNIGKAFDMLVTQEGVETKEEFDMMVSLGCDVIQGFYYAKPMFPEDFINFVKNPNDIESVRTNKSRIKYRAIKYVDFFENK